MDYDLSVVLENLGSLKNKDTQLIHFEHHKTSGSAYHCSRIKYKPESEFEKVFDSIALKYKGISEEHNNVEEYVGQCSADMIYHLDPKRFIQDDFSALMTQIANPEIIDDFPNEQNYNALLIGGVIDIQEKSIPVKLISIHKPVSILERCIWDNKAFAFKKLKILNLPYTFEILIVGAEHLFLMNQDGEKLFNLERSFKIQGRKVVSNLINMDFLSDGALFERYATSGRCPRRLAAYNEQTARKIASSYSFRLKVSDKFGIDLNQDNKLCINSKGDAEKLVDILCGRATTDFFDDDKPVQVDHKKAWGTRT
jgi:hypothetical protein